MFVSNLQIYYKDIKTFFGIKRGRTVTFGLIKEEGPVVEAISEVLVMVDLPIGFCELFV